MAGLMKLISEVRAGRAIGGDDAANPSSAQVAVYRKTRYVGIEINGAQAVIGGIVKRPRNPAISMLNGGKSELNVQGT